MSLVLPKTTKYLGNDRRRKTMFDIRIYEPDTTIQLSELNKVEEKSDEINKTIENLNCLNVKNDMKLIKFRSSSADGIDH